MFLDNLPNGSMDRRHDGARWRLPSCACAGILLGSMERLLPLVCATRLLPIHTLEKSTLGCVGSS